MDNTDGGPVPKVSKDCFLLHSTLLHLENFLYHRTVMEVNFPCSYIALENGLSGYVYTFRCIPWSIKKLLQWLHFGDNKSRISQVSRVEVGVKLSWVAKFMQKQLFRFGNTIFWSGYDKIYVGIN